MSEANTHHLDLAVIIFDMASEFHKILNPREVLIDRKTCTREYYTLHIFQNVEWWKLIIESIVISPALMTASEPVTKENCFVHILTVLSIVTVNQEIIYRFFFRLFLK